MTEDIINRLMKKQLKMATAESCTGGSVAAAITAVPGASNVFQGALVAYQNSVKVELLKVSMEDIQRYDVVSEQVVKQMVKGACQLFGVDLAVATTGYAGPTGGTNQIPVGTIWIACGKTDNVVAKCLHLGNNRQHNINAATCEAISLLNSFLSDV